MSKLRDLIQLVRSTKTAAEEREIITKECANIRSTMSSNNLQIRHRNVSKLIYIQLLGYPTQYGQMECIGLISSPRYADKRIGYLALMLLLDETQEVLTLVTNHIHNDLLGNRHMLQALSLTTIANIGSEGIAQDVITEVEKLLSSHINYIKKKAAAAAVRIVRKCPNYADQFIQKTKALLVERQLSLQLAGITLAIELCKYSPEAIIEFRKLIPTMINNLKLVVKSNFIPDFDVSGITHPFVQCKMIQFLGILGKGDKANSTLMYSTLNFIIANTSQSRNVGNAVLFETVKTILTIESDEKLLQNGVNVLVKLLLGKDSNYKYVALEYLQYLLEFAAPTIQKHKSVIIDCLRDRDHAIRKRALDLVYSLVNEKNVVGLVKELLTFLQLTDVQFKQDIVIKVCWLIEKFGPEIKWKFDSTLETIQIAGDIVPEEVIWNFVIMIQQNIDLQTYAVHKLFEALKKDVSKNGLNKVAIWAIGEYGDLLVAPDNDMQPIQPNIIIDLITSIEGSGFSDMTIKGEILTALVKLSARIPPQFDSKILEYISQYRNHVDIEIQQRAIEFSQFFGYENLRLEAVNRMPIPEDLYQETHSGSNETEMIPQQTVPTVVAEKNGTEYRSIKPKEQEKPQPKEKEVVNMKKKEEKKDDLLDILGISSMSSSQSKQPQQTSNLLDLLGTSMPTTLPMNNEPNMNMLDTTMNQPQSQQKPMDLMGDLLGMNTPTQPQPQQTSQPMNMLDMMNQPIQEKQQPTQSMNMLDIQPEPEKEVQNDNQINIQALNSNGIIVSFGVKQMNETFNVHATFSNTNISPLNQFSMKIAVPKWIELQLMNPTSNVIQPMSTEQVSQNLILKRLASDKPVVVKIKVIYSKDGVMQEENANVFICN